MIEIGSMFQESGILPEALKEESAVLCCTSLNKLLASDLSQQEYGIFLGMRRLYLIYKEAITFLGHTWRETFFNSPSRHVSNSYSSPWYNMSVVSLEKIMLGCYL